MAGSSGGILAIILLYNPPMQAVLARVRLDPRYLKNIEYGEPRPGHPEGKVRLHIGDLEANLERLAPRLTADQYWKLMFLVHVHDTFKADAVPDSPIESPHSHASLARQFAAEFTADADLLNMLQFHDVNYALWRQLQARGTYDEARFARLLETIQDWDLFLLFLILDGSSAGKDPAMVRWFLAEVRKYKSGQVDETWLT